MEISPVLTIRLQIPVAKKYPSPWLIHIDYLATVINNTEIIQSEKQEARITAAKFLIPPHTLSQKKAE